MIPFNLVTIFGALQHIESRKSAMRDLATTFGANEVAVFVKDSEGDYLPARGLPQLARDEKRWQVFLQRCAAEGSASTTLPSLAQSGEFSAFGIADHARLSIMVFMEAEPKEEQRQWISALLPLLGPKLSIERSKYFIDDHLTSMRTINHHTDQLSAAHDAHCRELQAAHELTGKELASRREAEGKLHEADRQKNVFLAMLAHELRNPLAPISMAAEILKISDSNHAAVHKTSQIIERQVRHMTTLLDDLLDVSRVTRGLVSLEKTPVNIQAVVEDAIEQARPLINARHHHLVVQMPQNTVRVSGDHTRLVQAVTNLLNNAAQYTLDNGEICLTLQADSQHVAIAIRDSGIGIDSRLLPHVFDLFSQAERSPCRSQGGLGLGLALARSLIEMHGGKISVNSEGHDTGSEFTIHLPRLIDDDEVLVMKSSERRKHPQRNPLRVMVVDDNIDAAQTLAFFLGSIGHQCEVAYSGHDALQKMGTENFQFLLLDIGLPDMDGYQLATQIKSMEYADEPILIALSGYGQEQDVAHSRAVGFDHHLVKPVDPRRLAGLLAEMHVSMLRQ